MYRSQYGTEWILGRNVTEIEMTQPLHVSMYPDIFAYFYKNWLESHLPRPWYVSIDFDMLLIRQVWYNYLLGKPFHIPNISRTSAIFSSCLFDFIKALRENYNLWTSSDLSRFVLLAFIKRMISMEVTSVVWVLVGAAGHHLSSRRGLKLMIGSQSFEYGMFQLLYTEQMYNVSLCFHVE